MKKALSLCFAGFCFYASQAQNTYNGALTSTSPTFNRPEEGAPPTQLSPKDTATYYNVIPLTISTAGVNTITCTTSADFDTFGFLYSPAGFDPLHPLTNVLVGDDDSGPGVNFSFTYNFTTTGVYYVVVTTFKDSVMGTYSVTTTPGGILPVRLLYFNAEKAVSENLLKWASAGESQIVKYQVQHSGNGNNFTDIDNAAVSAHNASTTSYYSFSDAAPYKKLNYYRLKIIGDAATIAYSIVAVVNDEGNVASKGLSLFPNPAENYFNIQTKAGQQGTAMISIFSGSGQLVYSGGATVINNGIIYVDVKPLAAGSYFVRIKTADDETTTLSFIKH